MKTSIARGNDGTVHLMFWCPGCDEAHGPIVERTAAARPLWTWNGDRERPTLSPSILVRGTRPITDEERHARAARLPFVRERRSDSISQRLHARAGWPDRADSRLALRRLKGPR